MAFWLGLAIAAIGFLLVFPPARDALPSRAKLEATHLHVASVAAFLVGCLLATIGHLGEARESGALRGELAGPSEGALSDAYRSLDGALRAEVIDRLRSIDCGVRCSEFTVVVYFESDSSVRNRFAGDLRHLLSEGGFKTEASSGLCLGNNCGATPMRIRHNPTDRSVAGQLAVALGSLIEPTPPVTAQTSLDPGRIMIDLDADPRFRSNGAAFFP